MIQLTCFVKAKPGLSREEFHRYWKETHAPLVASIPEIRELSDSYSIYPRLAEDYDRPGSPDYDGVAVHTFPTMADFEAYLALPAVTEQLGPDNEAFLDPDATMYILTDEGQDLL